MPVYHVPKGQVGLVVRADKRLFSRDELLSEATESEILSNASAKVRESRPSRDRMLEESIAWSEVANKVVGAEA